jgi:Cytochrome P460
VNSQIKSNGLFLSTTLLLCLMGCAKENPRVLTQLNQAAFLDGALPANPLQWKVITSAIDRKDATMYTLFGNDQAVQYARTNAQHDYPTGSVIALVTWTQQEDPRWFGGSIPAAPRSVEFVTVSVGSDHKPQYSYEDYAGAPLRKVSTQQNSAPDGRTAYLLSQRAAVMP